MVAPIWPHLMFLERQGGCFSEAGSCNTPVASEAMCTAKAKGAIQFLGDLQCEARSAFVEGGRQAIVASAGPAAQPARLGPLVDGRERDT